MPQVFLEHLVIELAQVDISGPLEEVAERTGHSLRFRLRDIEFDTLNFLDDCVLQSQGVFRLFAMQRCQSLEPWNFRFGLLPIRAAR